MLTFAVVLPERSRENAFVDSRICGEDIDRQAGGVRAGNCQEALPTVIASY